MINAARAPTLHRVNEYFGVDVVSVAMDGVAPELNLGRVHRRININSEVRHAPIKLLTLTNNHVTNRAYQDAETSLATGTKRPSSKVKIRSICCAKAGSWVTTKNVVPNEIDNSRINS